MNHYEFVLKFALPFPDEDASIYLGRLEAAGCDDALVGVGRRGRIALEFVRSAKNAVDAVVSALAAVHAAIPNARFIEAGPDLVGLTEAASLANVSRQYLYKLTSKDHLFPTAAVYENGTEMYHLSDVLEWLRARGYLEGTEKELDIRLEIAETVRVVNVAFEVRKLPKKISPEIEKMLCEVA